jgi:hypothetical protein
LGAFRPLDLGITTAMAIGTCQERMHSTGVSIQSPQPWPAGRRSDRSFGAGPEPQGTEAPGPADWETVCADARKSPSQGGRHAFRKRPAGARETGALGSGAAQQLGHGCGSAIGRAILACPAGALPESIVRFKEILNATEVLSRLERLVAEAR